MLAPVNMRIKNRIDTEKNWQNANPVLMNGEMAFVNLNGEIKIKVGDGVHKFQNLPYLYDPKIDALSANLKEDINNKITVRYWSEA